MTNLIMGAAKGYGWDVLEPFVTSCKRNCPDAELVLFVDDISPFTCDKLLGAGVTLIDVPDELRGVLIIHSRWKLYADILAARGDEFAQVFVSDTADVIFQGDIFAPFGGLTNWLCYATETNDIRGTKTGARINYLWLESRFGKFLADKFLKLPAVCCGTIVASIDEMKIFSRIMWNALKDDMLWGHEQAVMNFLVRERMLPTEHLLESDVYSGAILTPALIGNFATCGDFILRGDGQIPAVVHQYNRNDKWIRLVDRIYRAKNFQADPRFNDVRSTFEQAACLLTVDAVEAAAKLFIGKLLVAEDLSGCVGVLLQLWKNAMRKPLTQASGDIELAAQAALNIVQNFSYSELEKICRYLKFAHDGHHPVDAEFANSVARSLLHAAQQASAAGEINKHRSCKYLLEILGVESEATR